MSRTSYDVRRSINRYLTQFLPEDWDVRMSENEGVWERPSSIIQTAGPQAITNRVKFLDIIRPFVVYAYPKPADTIEQSEIDAQAVEDELLMAFAVGGHGGHPSRVPLYDYDGVAITEPLPDEAEPEGFIEIVDFTTDINPDPDDQRLFTVIGNLRVKWSRLTGQQPEGPTAVSVGTRLQVDVPI